MTETPIERLARRACDDGSFLGWQLAAFARARGFDDAALAAYLGCDVAVLVNVRLCGAVRDAHFRADVTCVADRFGLNVRALAEAAKPIPAEVAKDPAGAEAPGVVLAARDRGGAT